MSEIFRKARSHFEQKLPFVVYCKPNSDKIIALFQKNDTLFEIENTDACGFAFVSFDNLIRIFIPENQSDIYFENKEKRDFYGTKNNASEINVNAKDNFEKLVFDGIEAIKKKQFEKVVLSRKIEVELTDFDLEVVFQKLVSNYKNTFNYCFYHPKMGLWMGATPEQLVKVDDNVIKTVSLAGTQVFNSSKSTIWEQKEIKEQQIVTDFIKITLEKISDKITISAPYTFKAGNLVHLKSDIEAKISDEKSIVEITNLLHPTPAVCGFPSIEAQKFILNNENYSREFYSGFVGEWQKDFVTFKPNTSDLFVNLRCAKIENKTASIFVGCGVTNESNPEKEFFETQNKMQTMLSILS